MFALMCSLMGTQRDSAPRPSAPTAAELPPELAAALAAGLLPCLERLLRRAGDDPADPEAAVVCELVERMWH